jgi:hypothetical protein
LRRRRYASVKSIDRNEPAFRSIEPIRAANAHRIIRAKSLARSTMSDAFRDAVGRFHRRSSSHMGTEASATGVPEAGASPDRRIVADEAFTTDPSNRNPKPPAQQGRYVERRTLDPVRPTQADLPVRR